MVHVGAKVDYRSELSADAGPGARCVSGRGPARVLRSAGGDRQLHIVRGRARRPGNGLGLPTAPASSAQFTAHVADLAQLAMGGPGLGSEIGGLDPVGDG